MFFLILLFINSQNVFYLFNIDRKKKKKKKKKTKAKTNLIYGLSIFFIFLY